MAHTAAVPPQFYGVEFKYCVSLYFFDSSGVDIRSLLLDKKFGLYVDEEEKDVGEEGANLPTAEEAELVAELQPDAIKKVCSCKVKAMKKISSQKAHIHVHTICHINISVRNSCEKEALFQVQFYGKLLYIFIAEVCSFVICQVGIRLINYTGLP